eukprot:jgi/Mesvir1/26256/Mv01619-RA.1
MIKDDGDPRDIQTREESRGSAFESVGDFSTLADARTIGSSDMPLPRRRLTSDGEREGIFQISEMFPEAGEDGGSFVAPPRYALPNVSSVLPEYLNSEQDAVRRAFESGNYDTLQKLPNHIKANEITLARMTLQEMNSRKSVPLADNLKLPQDPATKRGLFSDFPYIPSPYELTDEVRAAERMQSEAARLKISAKDFLPGAGNEHRAKYQDAFIEGATYPYQSDPIESAQDEALRAKWMEDSKILAGPFKPTGKGSGRLTDVPSKALNHDILGKITKMVAEDWGETEFMVYENEEGMWVVKFRVETVESLPGLTAYMNVMVRCNEVVLKYQLTKAVENWDCSPGDGWVYYAFRPPWVKQHTLDPFYTLHPEERTYKTSTVYSESGRSPTKGSTKALPKP